MLDQSGSVGIPLYKIPHKPQKNARNARNTSLTKVDTLNSYGNSSAEENFDQYKQTPD